MIITGRNALFLATICAIIVRIFSLLVLRTGIRLLLKKNNSLSLLKKTNKTANFWFRISMMCFWNIKSQNQRLIHCFIVIQFIAIITWGIPVFICILGFFIESFLPVANMIIKVIFQWFDLPICFFVSGYVLWVSKSKN